MLEKYSQNLAQAIKRALKITGYENFVFKPMKRTKAISKRYSFVEGHTSLTNKTITIDIFTPRLRKPKKISAILAVLAHEIAHHQIPPYRQQFRGRIITRYHYPKFYKQVNKNIIKFKKDKILKKFYI